MTDTFAQLGLPERLVNNLAGAGFAVPTPIQAKAIPPQLTGRDILGIAQTGSGKTAAFVLPILAGLMKLNGRAEPRGARALILAPTRELAVQIDEVARALAGGMRLSTVLVLGGMSRQAQVHKLAQGTDIVIATHGRLKDLLDDKKLNLAATRWLVLDEADRMLDMGFIKPVRAIAAMMSVRRQTALFSATMAPEIAALAEGLLKEPVRVEAAPPATTAATIDQRVILAPAKGKRDVLNSLLADDSFGKVLVFARTKHGADRVAKNLTIDGHQVAAIHGNKSQNARQAALKGFADGRVRLLVATDIAARGIDVSGITHVVNFELPDDAENYVHRIGRTGRNGASGSAISLVDAGELDKLRDVEKLIRQKLPRSGELNLNAGGAPSVSRDAAPAPGPRRRTGARQQGPAAERPRVKQPRPQAPAGEVKPGQMPAWLTSRPSAQPKSKPRWTRSQRQAGRQRRAGGAGPGQTVAP